MKIEKINYTSYNSDVVTNLLQIHCDDEAGQSILAHIVKIQETHNKLMEVINQQAILLAECSEFVDAEKKQAIEDLNNFEGRVK